MTKTFYKDLDKANKEMLNFLNCYPRSAILQDFFISGFKSLFYGNLINNFFTNLNMENIKELKLPKNKIAKIKNEYKNIRKEIKLAISLEYNKVDEEYYNCFKHRIKKDFPDFLTIINEMENIINLNGARQYLRDKEKEIRESGKTAKDADCNSSFIKTALEVWVSKENRIPDIHKMDRLMKVFVKDVLPKFSKKIVKHLKKNGKEMLNSQRALLKGFEYRLYRRWKDPLDLLECLIRISSESGESHASKLAKITDKTNSYKRTALIKIHARALQISNEILALLKSGYADGAFARWRSLHELAVISFFLKNNNDEVSRRYLEHDVIKRFKEAKDYKAFYKKLRYPAFGRKEFNSIRKEHDNLINKYGKDFEYRNGFEWIPRSILPDRNFRALEKHVKLDKLHPFYNLSCNAVHGGARGFYRLGLMDKCQDDLHLVGPSNYGLADPIQNTAISLLHVTVCLLCEEPDFESIVQMHTMNNYVNEIGPKAVEIQRTIEKEEASRR